MPGLEDLGKITKLFHFTDSRNLPLIKEHGGILSSRLLREMGIAFTAGGNEWSIKQDLRTGVDGYVHLCWDTGHPMVHHVEQRADKPKLVYLQIHTKILERDGVKFSRDVANSSSARPLVTIKEACEGGMIDYDAINWNIGSVAGKNAAYYRRVEAELSEILVPDIVEFELILDFPNG